MATNFPTNLDDFTNPASTDKVTSPDHAKQHADKNDAIEAIEAKVGKDSSTVNSSHDRKLSNVTGSDKAVSLTGTETLTDKTLTSPRIGTDILDTNGLELIKLIATGSAVNEVTLANAATGNEPILSATGGDANVGIKLNPKGTGKIKIGSANIEFPNSDGTANQVIKTDGSGVLSFADAAGTPTCVTLMPKPNFISDDQSSLTTISANTVMRVGQIVLPFQITVNKITFFAQSITTSGSVKLAVYTEDGQTKKIEVTTASISGDGIVTTSVSAVVLDAGVHWIAFLRNGTTSFDTVYFLDSSIAGVDSLFDSVSSEPILQGTETVTASTIPSTITPTSVTSSSLSTLIFRLDN